MLNITQNINPLNCNLSYVKRGSILYLYIYTNNYFCFLKVVNTTNDNNTNIKTEIKYFLRQFYLCVFVKIKFTGKGYKIKKNNNKNMLLLFNRAHITNVFFTNMFVKKIKKYKIYIQCTPQNKNITNTILKIRGINVFTKKGLRKSRQIIIKKKSKK